MKKKMSKQSPPATPMPLTGARVLKPAASKLSVGGGTKNGKGK